MKLNKLALIVALAALVCSAMAQGGGGGGRQGRGGGRGNQFAPMTLAGREEVQKEIGLTDDQKTKITELRTATQAKTREARQAANGDRQATQEAMTKINADAAKSLAEILKPEQLKRLRELSPKLPTTTANSLPHFLGYKTGVCMNEWEGGLGLMKNTTPTLTKVATGTSTV